MIEKIRTSELRIGMYIDNLDCKWMDHPFVINKFPVNDPRIIQKIASAGIRQVFIDVSKGKDVEQAPTAPAADGMLRRLGQFWSTPQRYGSLSSAA